MTTAVAAFFTTSSLYSHTVFRVCGYTSRSFLDAPTACGDRRPILGTLLAQRGGCGPQRNCGGVITTRCVAVDQMPPDWPLHRVLNLVQEGAKANKLSRSVPTSASTSFS